MHRQSRKRDAILAAVRETKTHPSAAWVYARLKPEFPELSLGTVYRNLAAFRDEGRIRCVATPDGEERFDGDTRDHPHFLCESCGAVTDVETPEIAPETLPPGYVVRERQILYRGLCPECAKLTGGSARAR